MKNDDWQELAVRVRRAIALCGAGLRLFDTGALFISPFVELWP